MTLTPRGLSTSWVASSMSNSRSSTPRTHLVGRRLEDAAFGVGPGVDAEDMAARRNHLAGPGSAGRRSRSTGSRTPAYWLSVSVLAGIELRRVVDSLGAVDHRKAEAQSLAVVDDGLQRRRRRRWARRPGRPRGTDRAPAPRALGAPRGPPSAIPSNRPRPSGLASSAPPLRQSARRRPGVAPGATPAFRTSTPRAELSVPWFVSPLSRSMKGTRFP